MAECKTLFDVYSYYDDEQLDKDFPVPKEITTRYFKNNIEADEEYKNMSAKDLEAKKIEGITLRERLLLEIQYFKETNKHLDMGSITLCSGSRDSDGFVPCVNWYAGDHKVSVSRCNVDGRSDVIRGRATVYPSDLSPSSTSHPECVSRTEFNEFKEKVGKIIRID